MLKHLNSSSQLHGRVVVLGANGFIGQYITKWCLSNKISYLPITRLDIDLQHFSSVEKLVNLLLPTDTLILTAFRAMSSEGEISALYENIRIVENLILALRKKTINHLIYLSSDAVYDAEKLPLDEDSSREPTSLYALSHTSREIILKNFSKESQIPLCVLRLTAIFGTGDTHNAYGPNSFIRSALSNNTISIYGSGEERRSHVWIDDLLKIFGLVLVNKSVGYLNIANDKSISFATIANLVNKALNNKCNIVVLPRNIEPIHRPYKPTQFFRYFYNKGRKIGPIVHKTFRNKSIYVAFPQFKFTPIEECIKLFIEIETKKYEGKVN